MNVSNSSPTRALERAEVAAVLRISLIAVMRLLGLFMLLPVLSVWAADLTGARPLLIGLAVGGYGLTQALLQIPFGKASDRFGRRRVVVFGLTLFVLGSIVCAVSDGITTLILGRILQGAGAVSAAIGAWVADVSHEDIRVRATAILGATIGLTYVLSLVLGPALASWLGIPGVFWFSAILGGVGILIAATTADYESATSQPGPAHKGLTEIVGLKPLLASVFLLHTVLIAFFIAVPFALTAQAGMALNQQWQVYLVAVLGSLLVVLPLIRRTEQQKRGVPWLAWLLLAVGLAILMRAEMPPWLAILAIGLFFAGFNVLEAVLPALVSLVAPTATRGVAMGAYSTAHFLGAFCGGLLGGMLLSLEAAAWRFAILAALALVGLGVSFLSQRAANLTT